MKTKYILLLITAIVFITSCKNPEKKAEEQDIELKAMIGQMIMVGFQGSEIEEVNPQLLNQIDKGYIGGIILFDYDMGSKAFDRNIKSPAQVKKLINGLQSHAPTPLFMAIDQEGGVVNRLKPKYGFPKSVSAKYLGSLDNIDSTGFYANLNAKTLKGLGFNLNFAPVVDIDLNPSNPVIGKYERSFSDTSEIVVKHATVWVNAHDSLGILSTLKHFPGHGSADSDSHKGVTDITNYWQEEELNPFKELGSLDKSVAIMTAHVVNNNLDSVYPATMSKKIITEILRDQLAFKGLVFSDDLQMKAVNAQFDFNVILKNAINAGVDVLVIGNNLEVDETIAEKAVNAIVKMVNDGDVALGRIKESYQRVMTVKEELKL